MIELVLLAWAITASADLRRVGVLAAALYLPIITLALVALVAWISRRTTDSRPALFCEGVAAELRSGSPMRDAVAAAATSTGASVLAALPRSGASLAAVAHAARVEFEDVGEELELTIETVARSGARAADLFEEIGSMAIAKTEMVNEVRIASAPAKATAVVFLTAPLIFLFAQGRSGALSALLATPEQRAVSAVGMFLFVAGLMSVGALMWRAK